MDQNVLSKTCDKFFTKHNFYTLYPEKIESLKTDFIKDINSTLNEFWETDIEIYNKFHDQSNIFQSNVILEYLEDNYNEEPLTEGVILGSSFLMGLGAILWNVFEKDSSSYFRHFRFKVLHDVGIVFDNAATKLSKLTNHFMMSYKIVRQNSLQCYNKCGIAPENVPAIYDVLRDSQIKSNIDFNLITNNLKYKTNLDLGLCLRECYLSTLIDMICITAQSYVNCLKNNPKTTQLLKDFRLSDAEPLDMSLSKLRADGACSDIYDSLIDQYRSFDKALTFLFDGIDSSSSRIGHIVDLNKRLSGIFTNAGHSKPVFNQPHQQNKQPYTKFTPGSQPSHRPKVFN